MWRRPSNFPSWNPVPLPSCCNDPRARDGSNTHSSKLGGSCNLEKDTIRYYGPSMGYTPGDFKSALSEAGGDLILVGDSVTRQWFQSLSCYLGSFDSWDGFAKIPIERNRSGLEADITESIMRYRPEWRERGNLGLSGGGAQSAWGMFEVPSARRGAPQQRVMFHQVNRFGMDEVMGLLTYYAKRYPRDFKRKRPVFVINYGLHYHFKPTWHGRDGAPKGQSDLRRDLGKIVKFCRDIGARCIFRETSPQHFVNAKYDGLFIMGGVQRCMQKPPKSFHTLNRWRNDVLYDVIGEVGAGNKKGAFLRVMPLFDKLVGLSFEHHNNPDCTHFKMDPELWEPWHMSLTEVLRDVVSAVGR